MALLTPATGSAACVTAADLAQGIRVDKDTGSFEIYRTLRPGVVGLTIWYDDQTGSEVELAKGLYSLGFTDFFAGEADPETRTTFTYPMAPDDMPLPVAEGGWQTNSSVAQPAGRYEKTLSASWGQLGNISINGCTYAAISGSLRYISEGYSTEEGLIYLPDLGVSSMLYFTDAESDAPLPQKITGISVVTGP